jgi:hypothetical protein
MRPATQMPAIYPASTPDASSRARDLFALSSDLHRHLWQEVRDDELRHALYSEGDGVAAGPLSKRVDQCNRQLARRVLCGGDPQHCCGSHGAGRVAADATPTGAHAGFRWKSDFSPSQNFGGEHTIDIRRDSSARTNAGSQRDQRAPRTVTHITSLSPEHAPT